MLWSSEWVKESSSLPKCIWWGWIYHQHPLKYITYRKHFDFIVWHYKEGAYLVPTQQAQEVEWIYNAVDTSDSFSNRVWGLLSALQLSSDVLAWAAQLVGGISIPEGVQNCGNVALGDTVSGHRVDWGWTWGC